MEMPKSCFDCPFSIEVHDGAGVYSCVLSDKCVVKGQERMEGCPLKEYETTDKMTLAAAMNDKTFALFSMIAATDPLRPINVKMNYWKLFEIVKMLKEGNSGN